jgi:hypothetical protein
MRAAGEKWLPAEEFEEPKDYQKRIKRSFLYAKYPDTVKKLASRPFSKLITIEGIGSSWPWWLTNLYRDANKGGDSMTAVSYDHFNGAIDYGLAHLIVDFSDNSAQNRAEEETKDTRSIWRYLSPRNVIGWRDELREGERVLTQLRIREKISLPDGPYGEKEAEIITVWTEKDITKYLVDKNSVVPYKDPKAHTFGEIPVETTYTNKTGFMTAEPPLEDLAWLNVAHWQSDSQQRNILRFARIGIMLLTGVTEDEFEDGFVVAPGGVIRLTNKDANGKYLEYAGGAIPFGKQDLDDLAMKMDILGLMPMVSQASYATAFGRQVDENKQYSELQLWVEELRETIKNALSKSYRNQGQEKPKNLEVHLSYDASLGARNLEYVRHIIELIRDGKLPLEEGYEELKTLGVFSETFDVMSVAKKVNNLAAQYQDKSDGRDTSEDQQRNV